MADNRFEMTPSCSLYSLRDRGSLYYYGSEETFNRLPVRTLGNRRQRLVADKMNTLEVENAELRQTVANLRIENCVLRKKLLQESEKRDTAEYNKDTIAGFSCTEVQSMLEDIGLGDYVTRFAKELIDGSILIDLNEQVLKDELSMQTSFDRQKLMKIINGEENVKASTEKKLV